LDKAVAFTFEQGSASSSRGVFSGFLKNSVRLQKHLSATGKGERPIRFDPILRRASSMAHGGTETRDKKLFNYCINCGTNCKNGVNKFIGTNI
jgi:hypothetical protein